MFPSRNGQGDRLFVAGAFRPDYRDSSVLMMLMMMIMDYGVAEKQNDAVV